MNILIDWLYGVYHNSFNQYYPQYHWLLSYITIVETMDSCERKEWILSQWPSSILWKNTGQAGQWTRNLRFSCPLGIFFQNKWFCALWEGTLIPIFISTQFQMANKHTSMKQAWPSWYQNLWPMFLSELIVSASETYTTSFCPYDKVISVSRYARYWLSYLHLHLMFCRQAG